VTLFGNATGICRDGSLRWSLLCVAPPIPGVNGRRRTKQIESPECSLWNHSKGTSSSPRAPLRGRLIKQESPLCNYLVPDELPVGLPWRVPGCSAQTTFHLTLSSTGTACADVFVNVIAGCATPLSLVSRTAFVPPSVYVGCTSLPGLSSYLAGAWPVEFLLFDRHDIPYLAQGDLLPSPPSDPPFHCRVRWTFIAVRLGSYGGGGYVVARHPGARLILRRLKLRVPRGLVVFEVCRALASGHRPVVHHRKGRRSTCVVGEIAARLVGRRH